MELLDFVVGFGFAAGIVLAVLSVHWRRQSFRRTDPFEAVSTDVINAARIRVAGIGGLGLVAMAAVVALAVPRIGIPVGVGAGLGILLAAVLIALRHRSGALPSSGERLGANTTLSIDVPPGRR
jgi:hypothetical protein